MYVYIKEIQETLFHEVPVVTLEFHFTTPGSHAHLGHGAPTDREGGRNRRKRTRERRHWGRQNHKQKQNTHKATNQPTNQPTKQLRRVNGDTRYTNQLTNKHTNKPRYINGTTEVRRKQYSNQQNKNQQMSQPYASSPTCAHKLQKISLYGRFD